MENRDTSGIRIKKSVGEIDRELNTPLYLLRVVQLGISISDLELLSIGLVNDMFIEYNNDDCEYARKATQEDIDAL